MIRSVDMATAGFDWGDDGRSVYGRIFPFGQTAHIRELDPTGKLDEYDEEFLPGCTSHMRQAAPTPRWIAFTLDHSTDFDREMGCVEQLDEHADGVYALFRLREGHHLPKYQSMLRESHTGLSIEFRDKTRNPPTGPLRQRRQIHIDRISATPIPAYPAAQVLAMRSGDPDILGTPNLDAVRALLAQVRGEPVDA